MTTKPKPKVIAFYRVSALSQVAKKKSGIAAQKAAVERAAIHHDLNIVTEMELIGVPGKKIGSSILFLELLAMLKGGKIEGVATCNLDRIVHDCTPCGASEFELLVGAGATIYTPTQAFDLTEQRGLMYAFIIATQNQIYRRVIAKRSAFSRAQNRTIKDTESADAE
jgi:DNA invertase Pin-like site-specific DNA recombinase